MVVLQNGTLDVSESLDIPIQGLNEGTYELALKYTNQYGEITNHNCAIEVYKPQIDLQISASVMYGYAGESAVDGDGNDLTVTLEDDEGNSLSGIIRYAIDGVWVTDSNDDLETTYINGSGTVTINIPENVRYCNRHRFTIEFIDSSGSLDSHGEFIERGLYANKTVNGTLIVKTQTNVRFLVNNGGVTNYSYMRDFNSNDSSAPLGMSYVKKNRNITLIGKLVDGNGDPIQGVTGRFKVGNTQIGNDIVSDSQGTISTTFNVGDPTLANKDRVIGCYFDTNSSCMTGFNSCSTTVSVVETVFIDDIEIINAPATDFSFSGVLKTNYQDYLANEDLSITLSDSNSNELSSDTVTTGNDGVFSIDYDYAGLVEGDIYSLEIEYESSAEFISDYTYSYEFMFASNPVECEIGLLTSGTLKGHREDTIDIDLEVTTVEHGDEISGTFTYEIDGDLQNASESFSAESDKSLSIYISPNLSIGEHSLKIIHTPSSQVYAQSELTIAFYVQTYVSMSFKALVNGNNVFVNYGDEVMITSPTSTPVTFTVTLKDEDNQPLSGIPMRYQKALPTSTDENGEYSFTVSSSSQNPKTVKAGAIGPPDYVDFNGKGTGTFLLCAYVPVTLDEYSISQANPQCIQYLSNNNARLYVQLTNTYTGDPINLGLGTHNNLYVVYNDSNGDLHGDDPLVPANTYDDEYGVYYFNLVNYTQNWYQNGDGMLTVYFSEPNYYGATLNL